MNERNLTWKLNWYRQSELEGALLLGRLVGGAEDGRFAEKLTAHAADEARHSQLWAEAIHAAGLGHVRPGEGVSPQQGQDISFGSSAPPTDSDWGLADVDGDVWIAKGDQAVCMAQGLPLYGAHNELNILAACALVEPWVNVYCCSHPTLCIVEMNYL